MGTGSFARQSETSTNRPSTFAKSAGGSATQARLENFPPLRSEDRERFPTTAASADRNAPITVVELSGGTPPEQGKGKKKRLLLLLLLLFITFFAAFLGLGGLDLFGSGDPVAVNDQKRVSRVTPTVPAIQQEVITTEAPVAKPVVAEKTEAITKNEVEDDKLPEEVISPSMIPARIADVKIPETQYNISYPAPIPPPAVAAKSKTNFVSFEVNAKLAEDPDTRVFSMVPSETGKGSASLTWSTLSGAVLFRCKGLDGNKAGSNYVLYYIDENDKAQRMMAFAVASGAELMLIPPKIPSRGVKRVVLTLEKNVKTLEGTALYREEVLYSDYKEKALLSKPLK
jgi:hypothetical protein